MQSQFKSNGRLFLRNVLLYVLVIVPIASVCLMGAAWLHVCLTILALSLMVAPLGAFLVSRTDGFSFDDSSRMMIKATGKRVPYAGIKRVILNETAGLLRVFVKRGTLRTTALISALNRTEKSRLVEELVKRIPGLVIREQANADWKTLLLTATTLVFVTAGFHGYLYFYHPHVRIVPTKLEGMRSNQSKAGLQSFTSGDFSFSLPSRFRKITTEGDMTFFEDNQQKRTEVKVVSNPIAPSPVRTQLARYVTGIGDYADVLEQAFTARYGIIPLVLKDTALEGMDDLKLLYVKDGVFKGYITQGSRKGSELSHIMLVDRMDRREINFFMSGPDRPDEQTLWEVISSIKITPAALSPTVQ